MTYENDEYVYINDDEGDFLVDENDRTLSDSAKKILIGSAAALGGAAVLGGGAYLINNQLKKKKKVKKSKLQNNE